MRRLAGAAPFFAHAVLVQAITFVLRPTATYRAVELDVATEWLGALGASFAVVPLLAAVPSGHAADRFGERRVMLAGGLLLVAAAGTFVLAAGSVLGVVLASVVLGLGHLCSVVGQQAMVANRTTPARYDTAFGHYTFATSVGQAVGPGLIVLFGGGRSIPDTSAIFAWATALTVVLLAVTLLLPATRGSSGGSDPARGSMAGLVRTPGLLRALLVSCVVLAAVDITLVYLPALGAERGIAAGTVGILLAVRAAASMTTRLFLGRLVGWAGRRTVLLVSIGGSAVGLALAAVPMPTWLLALVVVLAGLGLGAGQPLTMSWLAETAPPGLRGRAMSLRLTGNRLGQVVIPSVAGIVAVGTGAGGVLLLTAAGLAAVGVAARRLHTP
ncbi:MAG TPA: MFS transporter [Nocardioidaceae bacterium]|nr:MFS transporter [Nocardioidaceae bacterium]